MDCSIVVYVEPLALPEIISVVPLLIIIMYVAR